MKADITEWILGLLGRPAICAVLLILILAGAAALGGCAGQGHSTTTSTVGFSLAALLSFFLAVAGFPAAVLVGILAGFGTLAIAPKYPLYPPQDPKGAQHESAPKPVLDRTLFEIVTGGGK